MRSTDQDGGGYAITRGKVDTLSFRRRRRYADADAIVPIRSLLIAVRPPVWHGLFEDLEPAVPDDQDDGVVDRVAVGIERE